MHWQRITCAALLIGLGGGCDNAETNHTDATTTDAAQATLDATAEDAQVEHADATTPDALLDQGPAPDQAVPDATRVDAEPTDAESPDAAPEDAGGPNPPPLTCPDQAFDACGGDLSGQWTLVDFCGPQGPGSALRACEGPGEDEPACQGGVNARLCGPLYGGTLDFAANGDLAFTVSAGLQVHYTFDDACLAAIGDGTDPEQRCTSIGNDRLPCAYNGAQCDCTTQAPGASETLHLPWAVDGAQVTVRGATAEFCAAGDQAIIHFQPMGPEGWPAWMLRRN